MKEFEDLKLLLESLNKDVKKFSEKGNFSAGTRVSVAMRSVIEGAKRLRDRIIEIKKETK